MIILYWLAAALVFGFGYIIGATVKRTKYESQIEEYSARNQALEAMLDHVRQENEEIRCILSDDPDSKLYSAPTGINYRAHTEGEDSCAEEGRFGAGVLVDPKVVEANRVATEELKRLLHVGPLK